MSNKQKTEMIHHLERTCIIDDRAPRRALKPRKGKTNKDGKFSQEAINALRR